MNWEAIGSIGEVVGALAVVVTLIILLMQIRQNTLSMIEANRLQKAAAIDKHAESVGSWRSHFVNSREVTAIWIAVRDGEELDEVDRARFDNLWVNFVNVQRSNYVRANVVGEAGLASQAAKSVAMEMSNSPSFEESWMLTRSWHQLASPDFVEQVQAEFEILKKDGTDQFVPGMFARSIRRLDAKEEKQVES